MTSVRRLIGRLVLALLVLPAIACQTEGEEIYEDQEVIEEQDGVVEGEEGVYEDVSEEGLDESGG